MRGYIRPPAESPPMTYTITVKPSQTPGKVTATSTNGHSLTTTTPLLDSARYWLNNNADPAAIIVTTWSSGPGHWSLRSTISNAAGRPLPKGQTEPHPSPAHAIISLVIPPAIAGPNPGNRPKKKSLA